MIYAHGPRPCDCHRGYDLVRYTARHGPFDGPASALRRDDLAVDDAVAEVRARRHGRLPRNSKWDVKGGGLLTFVDELFDLWYIAPPSRG